MGRVFIMYVTAACVATILGGIATYYFVWLNCCNKTVSYIAQNL